MLLFLHVLAIELTGETLLSPSASIPMMYVHLGSSSSSSDVLWVVMTSCPVMAGTTWSSRSRTSLSWMPLSSSSTNATLPRQHPRMRGNRETSSDTPRDSNPYPMRLMRPEMNLSKQRLYSSLPLVSAVS